MKKLVTEIAPYKNLYRDTKTGIAWVEDGSTGTLHSPHPNIDATGSVPGMKNLGYWRKDAHTIKSHGCIYNIDLCVVSDDLDAVAAKACQCGGNHGEYQK